MSGRIKLTNSRNTVATHPNRTKPMPCVNTVATHPNKGGGKGSSGARGRK
jgi:hypothetical protein